MVGGKWWWRVYRVCSNELMGKCGRVHRVIRVYRVSVCRVDERLMMRECLFSKCHINEKVNNFCKMCDE